jgi:ribose transport system permease protein
MLKYFNKFGILMVLIFLIIIFSILSSAFFTVSNLINVARQVAMIGISAVGMTLVILTGGIDLSVGSVIALTSVTTAIAMATYKIHPVIAVVIGLLIATAVGFINGLIVTRFKIPPFICTLGMMTGTRGLSYILTGGLPVYNFPETFSVIGKGYFLIIPIPVIIMAVVFIFGWFVLNKSSFGRYLYAIGGNAEASRLSGIKINKNLIMAYVFSGFFTGIAGIVTLSRISSGQPSAGNNFELDVITAVVLGGISIAGGEGRFIGVIYGVLIMGVLSNGMVLMNLYDYYQMVVKCIVLLLAVGFDQYAKSSVTKLPRENKIRNTAKKSAAA